MGQLFNQKMLNTPAHLSVVKLEDFSRRHTVQTLVRGLSPNLPSVKAVQGYSFLGLLGEVRPFNVGLGSKKPFQLIALPTNIGITHRDWTVLQRALQKHQIKTRPYTYVHQKKRIPFSGLHVQFEDIHVAAAFKAFVAVLDWAKERNVPLSFSPLFDKAIGTRAVRQWVAGEVKKETLMQQVQTDLETFLQQNADVLLYDVAPHIVRKKVINSVLLLS